MTLWLQAGRKKLGTTKKKERCLFELCCIDCTVAHI
jgi:hypothetical protein